MKVDLAQVEEAAKELYIRALKQLPPDVKRGFDSLAASELTSARGSVVVVSRTIVAKPGSDATWT